MLPRTGLQPRFQGRSASSQSGPGRYLGQVPIVLCPGEDVMLSYDKFLLCPNQHITGMHLFGIVE